MKPDDFETQLQRLPLRPMPGQWRAEILRVARRQARIQEAAAGSHPTAWWREWLWPCPQAWAGLAALWLCILGFNAATFHRRAEMASHQPPPEVNTTLAAQRRELARLLDNFVESTPIPRTAPPGPRSQSDSPPSV